MKIYKPISEIRRLINQTNRKKFKPTRAILPFEPIFGIVMHEFFLWEEVTTKLIDQVNGITNTIKVLPPHLSWSSIAVCNDLTDIHAFSLVYADILYRKADYIERLRTISSSRWIRQQDIWVRRMIESETFSDTYEIVNFLMIIHEHAYESSVRASNQI